MTTLESLYTIYQKHPVVTTDSRHCPEKSLFIALKGDRFNGNTFAKKALEQGCSYAVVDEPDAVTDDRIFLVDDCLKTLQALASHHRHQFSIPIIGITGTNGKTTTKELIVSVLKEKYNVLYTQGNLNNHIGVPLTLLKLNASHQIAVIEMGANHPGEIRELAQIADPDFGLVTNIGKAHLEGFGSFEGVVQTKGELYDYLKKKNGKIFIHTNNPLLTKIATGIAYIGYATSPSENTLWGETVSCAPFLQLRWHDNNTLLEVQTRLIGAYNLENVLAAICIGKTFRVENNLISKALSEYIPSNNRSQLQETPNNTLLIDAYNANPTSMAAAIKNFQQYTAPQKAVILGGMKELGTQSEKEHRRVLCSLTESDFDRVLLVGAEFQLPENTFPVFEDIQALTTHLKEHPLKGFTILIKGSRSNRLETIVPEL